MAENLAVEVKRLKGMIRRIGLALEGLSTDDLAEAEAVLGGSIVLGRRKVEL